MTVDAACSTTGGAQAASTSIAAPSAATAGRTRCLAIIDSLSAAYAVGMTYARLAEGPVDAVAAALDGRRAGIAVATSGSTGEPREVLLSTRALRASASATHDRLGGAGHWLLAVPADRIAGAMVLARAAIAGTHVSELDPGPFTAASFVRGAAELPPGERRYVSLVPTQLRRLQADPAGSDALESFDAVLVGGAAMLGGETLANVVTTYGMTETAGGCVYNGMPLDGVGIDVGDNGRIALAGPMLADGYADGDTSAWVTRAGTRWLLTNDAGELRDGKLEVWGRLDDVIVTGGLKVHPAAVERELTALAMVRDAVVVPAVDLEWGQRVVAIVEVVEGMALPSVADLRTTLGASLAPHELPRDVLSVERLPRLAHGKIDRRAAQRLVAN